jgi:hypothetical protein
MFWFSFAQIVVGLLIYQAAQKSVSKGVNPFGFIALAYGFGFLLCAAAALISRHWGARAPGQSLLAIGRPEWGTVLCALGLGVGATLIEIGYFLGYRSGWAISELPIFVMVATSVGLAAIGAVWFQEGFTVSRAIGLACCGAGLFLVLRK